MRIDSVNVKRHDLDLENIHSGFCLIFSSTRKSMEEREVTVSATTYNNKTMPGAQTRAIALGSRTRTQWDMLSKIDHI